MQFTPFVYKGVVMFLVYGNSSVLAALTLFALCYVIEEKLLQQFEC